MFKLFVALVVLTWFTGLSPVNSQQSSVSVKGRAVSNGSPVPNATVIAINKTTNFQKSSITDEQGYYKITGLPLGRYFVEIYSSGFAKTIKEISLQDYCRDCANANSPDPNVNKNKNININSNTNTNPPGEYENTLDFNIDTSSSGALRKGSLNGLIYSVRQNQPVLVRGALITISSEANSLNKRAVANSKGEYSIKNLVPGIYTIKIEAKGYQKLEMELVVEPGTVTRHFSLEKK